MRREALHVAVIVAAAAVAAALAAAFLHPPAGQGSSTTAQVTVVPVDKPLMAKVHEDFDLDVPLPDGTYASRYGRLGAQVTSSDADPGAALARARYGAHEFVDWLVPRQDEILRELLADDAAGDAAARRAVLAAPVRYAIGYEPAELHADSQRAPLRGALLGLFVAAFGLAASLSARRLAPQGVAADFDLRTRVPTAVLATASAALGAGLIAATAVLPDDAYALFLAALLGLGAASLAWAFGRPAVRALLIAVAVFAPLRAVFLAVTDGAYVAEPLLAFNAAAPALIGGCAVAAIGGRLGSLEQLPRPLVVGWLLIAGACALDFLTQDVGLTVYGIGLAQYLTYPTFALLAWLVLEPGDARRAAWLLTGLGAVVAGSIVLEAAGIVGFAEAASSESGLGAARYGGTTGSYLHASMFLGTVGAVALGVLLTAWDGPRRNVLVGAIVLIVAGMMLTFSRGGLAIFALCALLILIVRPGPDRRRVVGVCAGAVVAGALLAGVTGTGPGELGERVASGGDLAGDPGHELRFEEMREAVDRWRAAPAAKKVFGEGLAATGNARKVASLAPDPTESYALKLLVETGLAGLILIGGFLAWGLLLFARALRSEADPTIHGLAAGGVGLTLYSLVFPTLEAQVIALTWWLLLVVVLASRPRSPG